MAKPQLNKIELHLLNTLMSPTTLDNFPSTEELYWELASRVLSNSLTPPDTLITSTAQMIIRNAIYKIAMAQMDSVIEEVLKEEHE